MPDYKMIPAPDRPEADFAVILSDDALYPCQKAGETVYLQRSAELSDGDVGLFHAREGLVFRQFCQDSRGTVYLFALQRDRKAEDRSFPPGAELPVCYGRVLLDAPLELPMD